MAQQTSPQSPLAPYDTDRPSDTSSTSSKLDVNAANALAAYLNRAKQYTNDPKDVQASSNTPDFQTIPERPFKHRPLENYRELEALRLFFIKNGLDFKRPRSDLHLLNDEKLSPYIAKWEDCLTHWHTILGPNAFRNDPNSEPDCPDLQLFEHSANSIDHTEQTRDLQRCFPAFGSPVSTPTWMTSSASNPNIWRVSSSYSKPALPKSDPTTKNKVRRIRKRALRNRLDASNVRDAEPMVNPSDSWLPYVDHPHSNERLARIRQTRSSRRKLRPTSINTTNTT